MPNLERADRRGLRLLYGPVVVVRYHRDDVLRRPLTRLERVPHQIADAAAVIFHARESLLLAGEEQASRRCVDDAAACVVSVLHQA